MTASLNKDRKYLHWNNQRGISWIISRGYRWFKAKYLPSVRRLEQADLKTDRILLSDCYYQIGDIYDFIDCPKAAIKAYEVSFKLDPTHAEALRELGCMCERIGQYRKAVSVLKKSLNIDPEVEYGICEYESAVLNYGSPPLYDKNDICWRAREYLAQDKPGTAMRLLSNRRSVPARQVTACAHGVMDDSDGILDQWQRIANAKGSIEMGYADWFYIQDCVWDNAAFWGIIERCARRNRFNYGVWSLFPSLYSTVIKEPPNSRTPQGKAGKLRCNKRILLMSQYRIAHINRDSKLARKLSNRYPNWPEIRELKERLSN
ncbi:MAG: hypothetical protein ACYS8Z_20030 [Planctomycetota bacterium]